MIRTFTFTVALALLSGCTAPSVDDPGGDETAAESDELAQTTYGSARDYWKNERDQNAWFAMLRKIEGEFDNVCGDTFCGGDYSNLTSLGFECAVTSARGAVKECVWTFTGSSHLVQGSTGTVNASVATFQCRVAPKTSARKLLDTLVAAGADRAIKRVLPGANVSLYDVLGECFQHPMGATPISGGTGETYVDARDSYDAGTDVEGFDAATAALKHGFDNICGDTLCSGDYTNLQALRVACSVRSTTGTLRSCKWLFGGSYNEINPRTGAISVHAKTYKCTLPVSGKVNDLTKLLNAPSESHQDAIDRKLPGSTKSAYEVLGSCL